MSPDDVVSGHPVTILITYVDADARRPDPARVSTVSRDVAQSLRAHGLALEPAYTGERGGTTQQVIVQLARQAWDSRDTITALAGLTTPIIAYLLGKYQGRKQEQAALELEVDATLKRKPELGAELVKGLEWATALGGTSRDARSKFNVQRGS